MRRCTTQEIQEIAQKEMEHIQINSTNIHWSFDRLIDVDRILDDHQISTAYFTKLQKECELILEEKKKAYLELIDEEPI